MSQGLVTCCANITGADKPLSNSTAALIDVVDSYKELTVDITSVQKALDDMKPLFQVNVCHRKTVGDNSVVYYGELLPNYSVSIERLVI